MHEGGRDDMEVSMWVVVNGRKRMNYKKEYDTLHSIV